MAVDQLSTDFVAAYADWLGTSFRDAYELLKAEPLEDVTDQLQAAGWDESKHPRHPAGTEAGGEFAPKGTFVGLQGFERGPGRVTIAGERPRTPVGEIFAQAPAASLEAAVSDWAHLREQRPDMETLDVSELVPTQDVVSAVRVEEYLQELAEDNNLDELLDSVRIVEGDDGRLYIADGHNRVAAAMRAGHQRLYLPVIRPAKSAFDPSGKWSREEGMFYGTVHARGSYKISSTKVDGKTNPYSTAWPVRRDGVRVGVASSLQKAKALAAHDANDTVPTPAEIKATVVSRKYHWHELYGGDPETMSEERYQRADRALKAAYDGITDDEDRRTGYRNTLAETMRRAHQVRLKANLQAAGWDESKHPREAAGSDKGGQFAKKGAGGWYELSRGYHVSPSSRRGDILRKGLVRQEPLVPAPVKGVYVWESLERAVEWAGEDDDIWEVDLPVKNVYRDPNPMYEGSFIYPADLRPETLRKVERDELTAAGWEESEHPRWPKGHPDGGQFRPKEGGEAAEVLADVLGSARDSSWEGPSIAPQDAYYHGDRYSQVENSDRVWRAETNPAMQYTIDENYFRETIDRDYWDRQEPLTIGSEEWGRQHAAYAADVEEMMRHIGAEGELRTNTSYEAMQSIMDEEPRFKSQFETGSSGGAFLPPVRAAQEEMFFGYPEDLPPEQRPIYGWLGHPDADDDYGQYGEVTWFFKPELKKRTTIAFIDTLSRPVIPGPINNPGWRATVPPGYQDLGMIGRYPGEISDHVNETGLFDGDAIEVQMHGGVKLSDVASVRVFVPSWGAWSTADFAQLRRYRARLRKMGIRLEVVDENDETPGDMDE